MAVILYHYAGTPEPAGSLDDFTDRDAAGNYALDAPHWAVGEGLLTERDNGRLDPAGTAARTEAIVLLMRSAEKNA